MNGLWISVIGSDLRLVGGNRSMASFRIIGSGSRNFFLESSSIELRVRSPVLKLLFVSVSLITGGQSRLIEPSRLS